MRSFLFAAVMALSMPLMSTPGLAVEPDEILKDPALEARAREVGKQLRCVVCQNQAIDDSNAELARDMRILVRDRIKQGDSNQEVVDYMVDRYGDYVLLDPPFKVSTLVLWVGPGVIALLGVVWVAMLFRRRKSDSGEGEVVSVGTQAAPLSEEERRRLDALLKEDQ